MSKFRLLYERRDPTKLKKYDKKVQSNLKRGRPKLGDETAGVQLYTDLRDAGKSHTDAVAALAKKFGIKPETAEERLKRHGIRPGTDGSPPKIRQKVKQYSDAMRAKLFKNPSMTYKTDNGKMEKKFHKNKVLVPRLRLPDEAMVRGDTAWVGSYDTTSVSIAFRKLERQDVKVVRMVVDIPRSMYSALDKNEMNRVLIACAKSVSVYARRNPTDVFVTDRTDFANGSYKVAFEVFRDGLKASGFNHDLVAGFDGFAKDKKKFQALRAVKRNVAENFDMTECLEEAVVLYPLALLQESRLRKLAMGAAMTGITVAGALGGGYIGHQTGKALEGTKVEKKEKGSVYGALPDYQKKMIAKKYMKEGFLGKAKRFMDKATGAQRRRLFGKVDKQMDDRQQSVLGKTYKDGLKGEDHRKLYADDRYGDLNTRWTDLKYNRTSRYMTKRKKNG